MTQFLFVSALLMAVVPVSSFTVSRGAPRSALPLASRHSPPPPPQVRSSSVQLKGVVEIMDITTLVPVGLFVAAVAGTTWMQANTTDVIVADAEDVIAAEEMVAAEMDAMMKDVVEAEVDMVIKEEEATTPPPPAPKPAPKPAPVVTKTTMPETVITTPTAVPDLPKAAPTPRFNAFRKKEKTTAEKSISELKREVSSTLEGEKEKGERLRQAAAKREKEAASATTVSKAAVTTVAATAAAAATVPVVTSTKDIKLKKSSAATPTTTTTDSTRDDTSDEDDSSDDTDSDDEPVQKRGFRRKAWRVVKKVVAPWRKWKNIK